MNTLILTACGSFRKRFNLFSFLHAFLRLSIEKLGQKLFRLKNDHLAM